LVFGRFRDRLPALSRLREEGIWGRLRSCDPPITVPAWMVMMSGKDPGTLGFTGFRNRADRSYDRLSLASSRSVREPLLWDLLGAAGKRVILLGVPQTYPPRAVNGVMVSGFPVPGPEAEYTYPRELKRELFAAAGEYIPDLAEFRTEDKARLRDDILRMTEKRFAAARHLLSSRPWDLFLMVEMGTDRVHHGFWKHMDPTHPRHQPGSPWERVIEEYYAYVDREIARLLEALPADTHVLVVSDHGATALHGGICVNEWLIRKGYLVLAEPPRGPTRFEALKVDWSRTRAWGEGGYYARVFINLEGREPRGTVRAGEYEAFRDALARELEAIPDPEGRPIATRALKPETLYRKLNGIPPDLMVYFGDLRWRSVGSVGTGSIHAAENDTGPDDANHDFHGLFILKGPSVAARGERPGARITDILPTALGILGVEAPADLEGRDLLR
ncbi:MAG: alkaline phosphatase family protein, partial [Thermoanaerobaculia bacterium]